MAGDIIRTVVVAPTMENVAILWLIVLIHTFLSVALQLEVEGRWPWQGKVEILPPSSCPKAGRYKRLMEDRKKMPTRTRMKGCTKEVRG